MKHNMSTLSKAQISKIIQSGGSICTWFGNLGTRVIIDLAIALARDNLPGLVSNLASNAMNKYKKEISVKEAVKTEKLFALFISHEMKI